MVAASGSERHARASRRATLAVISEAIKARGITVIDVIRALADARLPRGGREPPERGEAARLGRLSADLGAWSATGGSSARSTTPTTMPGPAPATASAGAARGARRPSATCSTSEEVLRCAGAVRAGRGAPHRATAALGRPRRAGRRGEVVIGISPAFGTEALPDARRRSASPTCCSAVIERHRATAAAGRASCGCATPPTPRSSASPRRGCPARGVGIGIQAKGTAVIHQRRPPAAQQPRALLERADHHARALPRASAPTPPPMRGRDAGAGRGADRGRGDGRALPRRGRADLRDRDRPLRRRAPRPRRSRST